MPTGRVELVGRVEKVVAATPTSLWKKYGAQTGITRAEFFDYLTGCKIAYVILVADFKALDKKPTLSELRRSKRGFHPPQFAKMIENDGALHRALSSAVAA
jgi:predicted transcriptional regulator